MVFVFYALGIVLMLLIRPLIARKFLPKQGKFSIYAALYFYPILALLHAVGGGLICTSHFFYRMSQPHANCQLYIYFFCRLFFPLHHHYPVGALKCGAFRVQAKPNGKIFAIEFCLGYKKRDNSFGSLVAAWIRRDSSRDSSRNQHSSCDVSSSRVTRPILHYNSEIHRPTQAPYRMNLPSKFRVHIVSRCYI